MRAHDYQRDLDYSKLAWVDGLQTSYKDKNNGQLKYFSLDVNSHLYADYVIMPKLSAKERDKLNQYKQFAFSAAQNGDAAMAAAAIDGDNTAEIKKAINKFQELNRQHEEYMKQLDAQNAQALQQYELDKIQAQGEQDRQTLSLEKYLDSQIEAVKAMLSSTGGDSAASLAATNAANAAKNNIEREKVMNERQKIANDAKAQQLKAATDVYKADTQYKIAKENKNQYDKK